MIHHFIWPVRVYYEDTDAAGVVYYANYLKFLERARTEWLREAGFEQTHLKEQYKLILMVQQFSIDYLKPALFNDLLDITVNITKLRKASLIMTQQVLHQHNILCKAHVKIVAVNTLSLRPMGFPREIKTALQKLITEKND